MTEHLAQLMTRARAWLEQTQADGWTSDADRQRLEAIEQRDSSDLFESNESRPLVVAFFGGTGVGKSSLLNRVAGEWIARVGVERPTSTEVAIYVHESVQLAKLPDELPIEQVEIKRHSNDEQRDVLWIDAPDIDSAHEANRELALAWLPHVDLLIYVVSPERYRDDVGWRVLRERGQRHGWMFVMNRWDEGDLSQREDFERMLREAGFENPVLVTTSCVDSGAPLPDADRFADLEEALRALLDDHGVRELERVGQRARLLELRRAVQAAAKQLGDDAQWKTLNASRQRHWQQTRSALVQGLEWPLRVIASRFATRQRGFVGQVLQQATRATTGGATVSMRRGPDLRAAHRSTDTNHEPELADASLLTQTLWDDWTRDKLSEFFDALEIEVRRADIAAEPLRKRLDPLGAAADDRVQDTVRERLRMALAEPGLAWQRWARRATGFLMSFLPMCALVWVGFNLLTGYYRASTEGTNFLGTPFAVHSVLLVLVSWLLPYTCDRLLRPSYEQIALAALRQGLRDALDDLDEQVETAVVDAARTAETHRHEAAALVSEIARLAVQRVDAGRESIGRLLAMARS